MLRIFMLWSGRATEPAANVVAALHERRRPEGVREIPTRVLTHHVRHHEVFDGLEIVETEDTVRAFGGGWDLTSDPLTRGTIWIQTDVHGDDAAMAAIRHLVQTWGLSVYDTTQKVFVPGPDESPAQAMTRDLFFTR
ncbi:MAG: hypothetical protein H6721_19595 [Sandaracinus sp.]|nr:hypothetical protein [Myxococcales bacterium]MCB9617121.1 hypothetical protein [Sandaracinus sp.]MCB9625109.1 hypothetical protein [Sandaracinus sp.]MCB9634334.1 hypothetical protein [Sandaracinus sp.]